MDEQETQMWEVEGEVMFQATKALHNTWRLLGFIYKDGGKGSGLGTGVTFKRMEKLYRKWVSDEIIKCREIGRLKLIQMKGSLD